MKFIQMFGKKVMPYFSKTETTQGGKMTASA
jgi:hypothetical protein